MKHEFPEIPITRQQHAIITKRAIQQPLIDAGRRLLRRINDVVATRAQPSNDSAVDILDGKQSHACVS